MKKLLLIISASCFIGCVLACKDCEKKESAPKNRYLQEFSADIRQVLPDFEKFGKSGKREVELLDRNGSAIAVLRLAPQKYGRIEGFDGFIDTAVIVRNNKVIGVVIGANKETPRWMKRVRDAGFLKKWNGKTPDEAKQLKVDVVTGATYSSEAIKSEVKAVLSR